jgi:hypothetical protein
LSSLSCQAVQRSNDVVLQSTVSCLTEKADVRMTTRARLNRRMRWIGGTIYAGFGLSLAGFLIGIVQGGQPVAAIALPGFVVAFVVMVIAHFGALACPRCRGNLAVLVMQRGGLRVDPRVCFCPYCGVGLDAELPAEPCVESSQDTDYQG